MHGDPAPIRRVIEDIHINCVYLLYYLLLHTAAEQLYLLPLHYPNFNFATSAFLTFLQ